MNIAILLSGGTGNRFGGNTPKQYIKVGEKRIIDYSLRNLGDSPLIDYICIVAASEWQSILSDEMGDSVKGKFIGFALPGENRQLSIVNGLELVKSSLNLDTQAQHHIVFIHDAARPYLTVEMIELYINSMDKHDGVLPVLPMKDTIYLSDDGKKISSLIDRKKLVAGQAPEVFDFAKYYKANMALLPDDIKQINGSTEPAIMAGMDIAIVAGEEKNFKITTREDLERFEQSL